MYNRPSQSQNIKEIFMTIKQLNKIIKENGGDLSAIGAELEQNGLLNAEQDETLKKVSILNVYNGKCKTGRTIKNKQPNHICGCEIYTKIPDSACDGYQFILVTDYEDHRQSKFAFHSFFPCGIKIYAEKILK